MLPYSVHCAALLRALCCPTPCTVLPYSVHCAALLRALCCPTPCTVLPYSVHCAALLRALCCPTPCTVLPYSVHCAALLRALCCPTPCTVLPYSVHCAALLRALCCPTSCTVLIDLEDRSLLILASRLPAVTLSMICILIHQQLLNAKFSDAGNGVSMTSSPPPDGDRHTDIPTHILVPRSCSCIY